MNKVIVTGRITRPIEVRKTQNGTDIISNTIAISRNKDDTDFIPFVIMGKGAEIMGKYSGKGDKICLIGQIQTKKYTDKSNQERIFTEIFVEQIELLEKLKFESKKDEKPSVNLEDFVVDDDLPF